MTLLRKHSRPQRIAAIIVACADPAWSKADYAYVYVKRNDLERALAVYSDAARSQESCAKYWRSNNGGRFNIWNSAAENYSTAADLAFRLQRYSAAREMAIHANRVYRLMLSHPNPDGGETSGFIWAEITANDDLIARAHK